MGTAVAEYVNFVNIELKGGQITLIMADRFFRWKNDDPPILVENSYGQGNTLLVTSIDYPGSRGFNKFFKVLKF